MDWITVARLILEVGFEATDYIVNKSLNKEALTSDDYAAMRKLASRTSQDRMKEQLIRAGVPLTDPKAVALLALS